MRSSWRLCHAAAVILALSITYARGETCKPPNVARVIRVWAPGPVTCPPEGPCDRTMETSGNLVTMICLTPAEHAAALARQP